MNDCKCKCPDFKTHVSGISFARTLSDQNKAERAMGDNHDAYRRLRREGLQPKTVGNAAQIEKGATDVREVVDGQLMTKQKLEQRKLVRRIMDDTGVGVAS